MAMPLSLGVYAGHPRQADRCVHSAYVVVLQLPWPRSYPAVAAIAELPRAGAVPAAGAQLPQLPPAQLVPSGPGTIRSSDRSEIRREDSEVASTSATALLSASQSCS